MNSKELASDHRLEKKPHHGNRAGLLSCFVKRDAEPSEGECSLGEFFAEILQSLAHPLALTGSEGGSLAVHRIAVHLLHEPCPALAEIGLGDIAQADSLSDIAHLVTGCQFLTCHGGNLSHILTDLADAVKKLLRRYLLRLGSLVDHVVEILPGLLVFDVVSYSFHRYMFSKESPRRALLLNVFKFENQVEDYLPAVKQSVDEFRFLDLREVCSAVNRFDCPVAVLDAPLVEFKFFHLRSVWFNMLMISFDNAKILNFCLIRKKKGKNIHLFNIN